MGLRFARNRAAHDLLKTVSDRPGAILPMVLPMRFEHFVWRETNALPIPARGLGSGRDGQSQQRSYKQHGRGDTSTTYFANSDATSART